MVYEGWKFKQNLLVTDPSAADGALAKIIIPYAVGMASDFKDIRFSAGAQALKYWIETKTNSTSAQVWVMLPGGAGRIYLHYGNAAATSESSLSGLGALFADDLETGTVSSNWATYADTTPTAGTAGIMTDYKYSGTYSIGTSQAQGQASYPTNDECHTFLKILLTAVPNSTTFYVRFFARTWGTYDWCGIGLGSTSEIYGITADSTWHEYFIKIYRGGTSSWTITVFKDGTQVYTGTVSKTFTTYFNIGIQTRTQYGTQTCYSRMDNVLAWLGTAPTLTAGAHFQRQGVPAAILDSMEVSANIGISAEVSLLNPPVSAAGSLGINAAIDLKEYINPEATLGISAAATERKLETLSDYNVGATDVKKSITDATWELSTEFIGGQAPPVFFPVHHEQEDHTGTVQHLFTGISPKMDLTAGSNGNKIKMTAYDYAWYLSAQYVPDDSRTAEISTVSWPWSPFSTWEEWIEHLLEDTGINAYRIRTGPSVVWKQFIFQNTTTKKAAIDEISKYCGYIFEVKWRNYGTALNPDWQPAAYWVPEAEIDDADDGLDVPSPLTLSWPDPYLVDLPTIDTAPEERVNRVRIIGSDSEGNFYSKTVETAAVTAGTELPREYMEESSNLTTQTQVNTYASSMLTYFTRPAVTVSMRFIDRFDLQLYQKIKFDSSFPAEFYELTNGDDGINYLRIVGIKYHTEPANNYVDVTCVYDHPIIIIKNRQHVLKPNWISEMEQSVKNGINSQLKAVVGTIDSIDTGGKTAVLITEFGSKIRVRIQ